ncbi:MAG: diphthine--ammonia ligase [archaeon]
MKLVSLFSGGKDSTFAIHKARREGHEIVCLLTMLSENDASYMFHTSNIKIAEYSAACLDLPIIFAETKGEKEKELSDLSEILHDLKKSIGIEGVLTGAIKSNYQKERVDNICEKLNLKSVAPLWHTDERKLIEEMLAEGFQIIFVGVAAAGLDESWLGRMLDEDSLKDLIALNKKYGISIVGEGGETESFVLDCPIFKKSIIVLEGKKKWNGIRGEYEIIRIELKGKR